MIDKAVIKQIICIKQNRIIFKMPLITTLKHPAVKMIVLLLHKKQLSCVQCNNENLPPLLYSKLLLTEKDIPKTVALQKWDTETSRTYYLGKKIF